MHLHLMRLSTSQESTGGALYINGEFSCFTLEDTQRYEKIEGETRIPSGFYDIALRNAGGMTKRYEKRFGELHKGMLWLRNVPNFKWVYIHSGNKKEHTEGCILVGDTLNNNQLENGFTGKSSQAYKRIYPSIVDAILFGSGKASIQISNFG